MDRSEEEQPGGPASTRFSDFIHDRKRDILDEWARAVAGLPKACDLDRPALLDHIPALLDRIAEIADELVAGGQPHLPSQLAEKHALERLEEGFDLAQVVAEFAALRDCIVSLWATELRAAAFDSTALRALNQAIDKAVAASIDRYVQARDRTLQSLDRISAAALEARSLDEFLERLLRVLLETTAAVDTTTILLREGDRLVVRASVGLEPEISVGLSLRVGDGFAGTIAKTGRPLMLTSASTDPLVLDPSLRAKGVNGIFGVPLVDHGEVLGVAHMGSLTAHQFSEQDKRLLSALAARATTAIVQHLLREATERSADERNRLLGQAQRDRAEAERALAVVDALLSSSLIGVGFIDRDLRYVRINDALAAINGRPAAEHLGRTVREILGHQADGIEPVLRRIIDTGEPIPNLELTAAPPGTPGQVRSFLANYFPVRTPRGEILGVGAAIVEITDRARANEALRRSEERLKRALSIETVGVLFFSLDGRMHDANPALERMSGYSRDELRNMDWHVLTPPEFLEATAQTVENLATIGETRPYEKQWVRRDGSRWWGLFAPTRLSGSGSASECVEFTIDISERKRAEEALQAAMRAREEILAVVSHDLKNPLGAINLATAMLARRPSPDQRVRRQVERIQRSASRMDHLIDDLLDMGSIQAGRLAVARKPEDTEALVREVVDTHEPVARAKGVKIVPACALHGQRALCDRDRVLQVFGNLLGNAIKFCRADDVITIDGEIAGSEARFTVSDTGPGIAADELPHVFEPYWSGQRETKEGTGLGLYISKGIIEAHGGRIQAESKQGAGATFSFTLPLAEPANAAS